MKDQILIVSESQSPIDFNILNSFYPGITEVKKIEDVKKSGRPLIDKEKLVVIDLSSIKKVQWMIRHINKCSPETNILIIQSFEARNRHKFLNYNRGFGQMRILNYRDNYPQLLVEAINQLMYPQYPVGASDVAIILPVYNEESRFENVVSFFEKVEVLCSHSFINATVYFVNDGSKDRTQELVERIIDEYKADTTTVSNIAFANTHQLTMNTRKAGTYIDGIKTIHADVLLFVDADDSFRIEDMAKMINIIREGYYELVVGTKDLTAENRPPIRKLMSFVKRQLTKSLLPRGVYDSQTGLKAISATAGKYIFPHLNMTTGLAIDLEILHMAKKYNFRTLQIPVSCIDQDGSHIDIVRDSIQFVKNVFVIKYRNRKLEVQKNL